MSSIFGDQWRATQIAYFEQMMRTGNAEQRANACQIMRDSGFSDQEINDLYIQATMHLDDVPDDFVPDLEVIESLRQAATPHPNECTCPTCRPNLPKKPS